MAEDDRVVRVWTAIRHLADGGSIGARHVCHACAALLDASGVSLYLIGDFGLGEPIYATEPAADRIAELQLTLGEGPSVEALEKYCPVLVPDLAASRSTRRWPVFAPAAVSAGVRAAFAFPLASGAISVGALEIHRPVAGSLSQEELGDALLFADAAMELVLDHVADFPAAWEEEALGDTFMTRWVEVHQAVGMVSAQLRSGLTEAFLRLRAHAYVTGRRLSDIAEDVVTSRLRFYPDEFDGDVKPCD